MFAVSYLQAISFLKKNSKSTNKSMKYLDACKPKIAGYVHNPGEPLLFLTVRIPNQRGMLNMITLSI